MVPLEAFRSYCKSSLDEIRIKKEVRISGLQVFNSVSFIRLFESSRILQKTRCLAIIERWCFVNYLSI